MLIWNILGVECNGIEFFDCNVDIEEIIIFENENDCVNYHMDYCVQQQLFQMKVTLGNMYLVVI